MLHIFRINVRLSDVAKFHWLGLFASNFLPSTVGGDAVIAALLHRQRNELLPILSGLAANRIVSFFALAALLPFILLIGDLRPLHELALQSFGGLSVLLIGFVAMVAGLVGLSRRRSGASSASVIDRIGGVILLARAKPKQLSLAWCLSIFMLAVAALGVSVLNWSIKPDTPYLTVFGVMLIYSAVQLIPVAFNGIGLQETAITVCFTQIGWPLEAAIAFSLGVRMAGVIISLPGLPILLSVWPKVAKMRSS